MFIQTKSNATEVNHQVMLCSMVGMLVPLKGGIGSIFHPPGSARTISGI